MRGSTRNAMYSEYDRTCTCTCTCDARGWRVSVRPERITAPRGHARGVRSHVVEGIHPPKGHISRERRAQAARAACRQAATS